MTSLFNKTLSIVLALLMIASPALAQFGPPNGPSNLSRAVGVYYAVAYAYGTNPAIPPIRVFSGNTSTGTATITLYQGSIALVDGRTIVPFALNTPITIDIGANQETVTPSAVSGCTLMPGGGSGGTMPGYGGAGGCTITANFTYTHGEGALIQSGTYGLQEAANDAMLNGGGLVVVDNAWATLGGTTSMLNGSSTTAPLTLSGTFAGLGPNNGFVPNVTVEDVRSLPVQYWAPRASTLSLIAAGSAVTLTQSAGGSLTSTGTYYYSYEYVDALGGISLPATDSAQLTLAGSNQTFTAAAPSATAGAVGYIPMVTASGGSTGTEIEVPVTSAVCTVATNLVATGKPVCAISSTAVVAANPSSTAKEVAVGSAHTTFAPIPFATIPQVGQQVLQGMAAGGTVNSSNEDLAVWYMNAGQAFNYLGRSWDICIKAKFATEVAASVAQWTLKATTQYGQSPVTLSTVTMPTQTDAATAGISGCWTLVTNVTGSSGKFLAGTMAPITSTVTSTGATVTAGDTTAAVSSAINLTGGLYFSINLAETIGDNITAPQILAVTIRPTPGT
jgi:hypothetical protein